MKDKNNSVEVNVIEDKRGLFLDYRTTEIGRQNWEVCARMLVHDLLDMDIPEVKALLDFYSIQYTENGGYTMALPRKMLKKRKAKTSKTKESKTK